MAMVFRCVGGIGVSCAAFSVIVVVGMNRPHVTRRPEVFVDDANGVLAL
jgi:hypothetical protein